MPSFQSFLGSEWAELLSQLEEYDSLSSMRMCDPDLQGGTSRTEELFQS
jgi:hypothetical protein